MKSQEVRLAQRSLVTFADGRKVIGELFPNARITSGYRGPNDPLSIKNPKSYHASTKGAVDIAPIPGVSFKEYISSIKNAGYKIIEARDEVKNPSKNATGPHWHVVIGN